MNEQTIKMAGEIADLRERREMTFKEIGELYQISPGRASYLYQDHLRRRRIARYREIHEKQNQMPVCVKLTLGEVLVLQRILSYYQGWKFRENSRRTQGENPLFEEPDCITARYLCEKLLRLEKEKRRESRENEDLSPKSIDISETDWYTT